MVSLLILQVTLTPILSHGSDFSYEDIFPMGLTPSQS